MFDAFNPPASKQAHHEGGVTKMMTMIFNNYDNYYQERSPLGRSLFTMIKKGRFLTMLTIMMMTVMTMMREMMISWTFLMIIWLFDAFNFGEIPSTRQISFLTFSQSHTIHHIEFLDDACQNLWYLFILSMCVCVSTVWKLWQKICLQCLQWCRQLELAVWNFRHSETKLSC